jgi:hypothetical protein
MNDTLIFKCIYCHKVITNPSWSLDRNTQKYATIEMDGKTINSINIHLSQEMFQYDSKICWLAHEPSIVKELKLKTTYPHTTPLSTPCSRCGDSVDRKLTHISYTINAMNLEETSKGCIGHFVEGDEFAVLCPNCEESDLPMGEASEAFERSEIERA